MQRIELSNALLSIIRAAVFARSAVASTNTGTFPGPTPIAGFPLRYADRTTGVPPVATTTSVRSSVIKALINGIEGSSTIWMMPSGAPAATAASDIALAAATQTFFAIGCGLMMMELRVIKAKMILKETVATGLVDGVSAKITPAGRGIATILLTSSISGETKS